MKQLKLFKMEERFWKEVRANLKECVGDFYKVASTGDVIYIGSDLPSEYSGSEYTKKLNGAAAKAKANAAQGLHEIIERYNVFHTSLIIRHANDGKMYLYDIIDIKKETSTSLET